MVDFTFSFCRLCQCILLVLLDNHVNKNYFKLYISNKNGTYTILVLFVGYSCQWTVEHIFLHAGGVSGIILPDKPHVGCGLYVL